MPLRPPDSEHYESCGVEEGLCNSLHAHAKAIVGEVTRIYEVELNATGPMNTFKTLKDLSHVPYGPGRPHASMCLRDTCLLLSSGRAGDWWPVDGTGDS